jgi:hypothetical protein
MITPATRRTARGAPQIMHRPGLSGRALGPADAVSRCRPALLIEPEPGERVRVVAR